MPDREQRCETCRWWDKDASPFEIGVCARLTEETEGRRVCTFTPREYHCGEWGPAMPSDALQLCSTCGEPTGRCEDDSIYVGEAGPLCEGCRDDYQEDFGDCFDAE